MRSGVAAPSMAPSAATRALPACRDRAHRGGGLRLSSSHQETKLPAGPRRARAPRRRREQLGRIGGAVMAASCGSSRGGWWRCRRSFVDRSCDLGAQARAGFPRDAPARAVQRGLDELRAALFDAARFAAVRSQPPALARGGRAPSACARRAAPVARMHTRIQPARACSAATRARVASCARARGARWPVAPRARGRPRCGADAAETSEAEREARAHALAPAGAAARRPPRAPARALLSSRPDEGTR